MPRQSPTEREAEAGWLEYPDDIDAGTKRVRERERERGLNRLSVHGMFFSTGARGKSYEYGLKVSYRLH